jgi:hypothetical protein
MQSQPECERPVRIYILNLLLILCCILFLALLLMSCSSYQSAALHCAAYNSHPALCELLIAGKADVDAKDLCALYFAFAAVFVYFVF